MNVLVFGASGRTGRLIVSRALDRGMRVTGFVRDPARLPITHTALRVIQGDVADAEAVVRSLNGHDAVVSALGVGTPLKHDPKVISGVRHIVEAMRKAAMRRLVYQSFIGVRDSRPAAGPLIRYVARFPLRHEIGDHEVKEGLVRESGLDWTIVRPPKLTDGPPSGAYRSGEDIVARSFFPRLSRTDVAEFMVGELASPRFVGKAVRLLP